MLKPIKNLLVTGLVLATSMLAQAQTASLPMVPSAPQIAANGAQKDLAIINDTSRKHDVLKGLDWRVG